MPKATSKPTTFPPAAPSVNHVTPPPLFPFPSIYDLAIAGKVASDEHARLDRLAMTLPKTAMGAEERAIDYAMLVFHDREEALRKLTFLFPAQDLRDAVAQLHAAFVAVDRIQVNDLSRREIDKEVLRIRRAVLSCLPVVAANADVSLDDIGEGLSRSVASEFHSLGAAPQLKVGA
jgi:hypothetical protein